MGMQKTTLPSASTKDEFLDVQKKINVWLDLSCAYLEK